ncbi:MAG: HEPN domain-containing protein [Acidobacteria bacterium]|nr:HEPN domain-containing protein [Acidobacteriota bacterium]
MDDREFGQRVFQQFMDLLVMPAVQERQASGELPRPLRLKAAQIIFFPDGRRPLVRINEEIKAIGQVKLKAGVEKKNGDPILSHEIEGWETVRLSDQDDPDCGHAILIRLGDAWIIFFDFRYNKKLANRHINKAVEFFEVAEVARTKKHWSPFVDNLFSAAELTAKSILLATPNKQFREKTGHKAIHSRFNRFAHLGNVKQQHTAAFNKMHRLRGTARYLKGELNLDDTDSNALLDAAREMIAFAKKRMAQ